jgi:hypothetical protein
MSSGKSRTVAPPLQRGVKRYDELSPGYEECYECGGDGVCYMCDGTGVYKGERCMNCHGSRRCVVCRGAGQIPIT